MYTYIHVYTIIIATVAAAAAAHMGYGDSAATIILLSASLRYIRAGGRYSCAYKTTDGFF